ncbi:MAG TPA: hypothetical protein VN253_07325 [Kofleriaceae bacterium]|nr:hypothetical protein [Kofleriaceae bacterium]
MTLTRMIFAIHKTDTNPTRLRVSGNIGTPAPALTYLRRGGREPSSVSCVDGAWTMDLDAGDYLVEIQVEDWVAGRLDVVAELTPGQSPPIFVYYGPLPGSSPPVDLAAWEAAALYIDPPASSAGDPKDPWPPPPPPPRVTLAPESAAWFAAELATARARIAEQRAEAGGKGVPASVLDAFVTGS